MRMTISILLLGLALVPSSSAFGWGDAGHKIVAAIAFRSLDAAEQNHVVGILRHHPRFRDDFANLVPNNIPEEQINDWLVQHAAVWPDLVRGFKGELKDEFHRPSWHYINVPLFLVESQRMQLQPTIHVNLHLDPPAQEEDAMNVVQTIRFARRTLASPQAPAMSKGLMLCWLIHTVGDLHQPLHASALYSKNLFPHNDRGGNLIKTEQRGDLHAVWDQFPGGKLAFRTVRNEAARLRQELGQTGHQAALDLNESTWLDESRLLAETKAYSAEILVQLRDMERRGLDADTHPLDLSEDYLHEGGIVAQQRLVQAGFRLGAILRQIAR